jgi:DeoR/GlpR family transcriptional regulator of sugar metabolism
MGLFTIISMSQPKLVLKDSTKASISLKFRENRLQQLKILFTIKDLPAGRQVTNN